MGLVLGLLAALGIVAVLAAFLTTDARRIAAGLRAAGPLALGLLGAALLVLGRFGVGGALLAAAVAWFGASRKTKGKRKPQQSPRSSVRTAALEMELDHATGALEGVVLAGRHEHKVLGKMKQAELIDLHGELSADSESRQLLETYLDGRFPVWRKHAKPDRRHRQSVAPRPGAMTKEEAYKILGLEAGATAADVRQAHRRLLQRLGPDVGGTSFLAARINQAKKVLLSTHD